MSNAAQGVPAAAELLVSLKTADCLVGYPTAVLC